MPQYINARIIYGGKGEPHIPKGCLDDPEIEYDIYGPPPKPLKTIWFKATLVNMKPPKPSPISDDEIFGLEGLVDAGI